MTEQGEVLPAERARREQVPAAPSGRSGPDDGDGSAEWAEWYEEDSRGLTFARQVRESPHDKMRRAFLAGWAARDTAMRRAAADELTALTEELGLYGDRGGS